MKCAKSVYVLLLIGGILAPAQGFTQSYPVIDVKVDRAKVMRVSRPADMIIIGNPSIADATIKDSQTLIITGKQYGTTNLIVLDANGEPIADELLTVSSASETNVVVYKGAKRQTLSCSPDCEPVFRMGDDQRISAEVLQQINAYANLSKGEEAEIDTDE